MKVSVSSYDGKFSIFFEIFLFGGGSYKLLMFAFAEI